MNVKLFKLPITFLPQRIGALVGAEVAVFEYFPNAGSHVSAAGDGGILRARGTHAAASG